ncbi:MAG: SRPBCC domain-containing protein [Pyrinomonadaceae bacterium]
MKAKTDIAPRMSDTAVAAKTGKNWKEWFSLLDKAGALKMSHQEIVKHLSQKCNVGPWWQQMVTVTYEQARGLREIHQKPAGYQISVSRTVNTPLAKLYKSFANAESRSAWLAEDGLDVRTATPDKSMRVTWNDKKTRLEINFYQKGADKSQVVVQHSKLPDAKSSARMKTYWGKALDRLRASLEK